MVNSISKVFLDAAQSASQGVQKVSTVDYIAIFKAAMSQVGSFILSGLSFIRANPMVVVAGTAVAVIAYHAYRIFNPTGTTEEIEANKRIGELRKAFQIEDSKQFKFLELNTEIYPKQWPLKKNVQERVVHAKLKEIDPSIVKDRIMITTIEDVPVLIAKARVKYNKSVINPIDTLFFFVQSKDISTTETKTPWKGFYVSWDRDFGDGYEMQTSGSLKTDAVTYDRINNGESIPELLKGKVANLKLWDIRDENLEARAVLK